MSTENFAASLERIATEWGEKKDAEVKDPVRWIYDRHYAHIRRVGEIPAPALDEAGSWEGGWKLLEVLRDGALLVGRDCEERIVGAGTYCRQGAMRSALPGDGIELWRLDWSDYISPGFRYYFGREIAQGAELGRRRFYFNARPERRLEFASRLVASLRRAALPFTLKAERNPSVERRDGVVLYVNLQHSPWTCIVLAEFLATSGDDLCEETSPFALRLAEGVAAADAPADGESFGMYVSERIVHALEASAMGGKAGRLGRLGQVLRAAGIDLQAPWRLHQPSPFPISGVRLA